MATLKRHAAPRRANSCTNSRTPSRSGGGGWVSPQPAGRSATTPYHARCTYTTASSTPATALTAATIAS
eukprot:2627600-Lingulodinium_polyedra.AAC.1